MDDNKIVINDLNEILLISFDILTLHYLTFGNGFNQPLRNSLDKLTLLQHLTFGKEFNQPLSNSLNKLTSLQYLALGYNFNQPLELPSNIKHLVLYCDNQNLINNIPNSIEELEFNGVFTLPLENLPNSIKKISFGNLSQYNCSLNNLPRSLEQLTLSTNYKIKLKNIPQNCKIIYL